VNTIVGGSTNTPTDLLLLGIDQSSATDNEKVKAFSQRFLKNILLSAIPPIIITIMTVLTATRTVIFERALKKSSLIKISEESFNYALVPHKEDLRLDECCFKLLKIRPLKRRAKLWTYQQSLITPKAS
jgi:hypothetical protein